MSFLAKTKSLVLAESESFSANDVSFNLIDSDKVAHLFPKELRNISLPKIRSLKWSFSMDQRAWGIKSFYVSVPDQEIEIYGLDEESSEDVSMKIKLKDVEANLPNSLDMNGHLFPSEISVYQGKFAAEF